MSEHTDFYKCRYCPFTVMKWRTLKSGRSRSGWGSLQAHIEQHHPEIDPPDLVGDCGDEDIGDFGNERAREVQAGEL